MSKKNKKRQNAAQTQKTTAAQSQQSAAAAPPAKGTSTTPKSSGARSNKATKQTSFPERLLGVVTLKPAVYREIAHDHAATMQAAIVVIVVALIVGAIAAFSVWHTSIAGVTGVANVPTPPPTQNPIARGVVMILQELLIWGVASWLIAAVAKGFFKGETNTGEMLRVFGYTRIFQILLVLGVFGSTIAAIVSIIGLALSVYGSILGIREATGFTMGKAAVVGIFSIVLVAVVISFFTAFVLNPFVTSLLPT